MKRFARLFKDGRPLPDVFEAEEPHHAGQLCSGTCFQDASWALVNQALESIGYQIVFSDTRPQEDES